MKNTPCRYDAVIVGSGFGGAMAADVLVRAGWRVLVIERGGWVQRDEEDWDAVSILVRQRYQSRSPLLVKQYGARSFARVPANTVVGGQSVFYGGASLRLRERDLERWPLSYADLEPFYVQAERLLGVHGEAGVDPCEGPRSAPFPHAPVDLSPPAVRIQRAARAVGMHPFPLPLAINFSDARRPLCIRCNTCDGFPCKLAAKNDLAAAVLAPLQSEGLEIMAGTVVRDLVIHDGRAREVRCVDARSGAERTLEAGVVILAAGAVNSPPILLRSGLESYPQHELIGRFLMRHCNAVASYVFPFRTNPRQVYHKQLCLADLYEDVRAQWGTAVGVIQDIYTPAVPVLRHAAPFGFKTAAAITAGLLQNLLCIAEDEPRYENRVSQGSEQDAHGLPLTTVVHEYTERDNDRLHVLLRAARRILRRAGGLIPYTYRIDSFSHAVGTLRCGVDARDSVVDTDCRVHGVDNLYVTDASIFPVSGGVNPSLTVAANALRVAAGITARHQQGGA